MLPVAKPCSGGRGRRPSRHRDPACQRAPRARRHIVRQSKTPKSAGGLCPSPGRRARSAFPGPRAGGHPGRPAGARYGPWPAARPSLRADVWPRLEQRVRRRGGPGLSPPRPRGWRHPGLQGPPQAPPGGHPHAADPFRSTPPCAEPPLPRADGRELMYRWMKHEPLGPYLDEGEAEKELEREEKAESPPTAPQPRYPSVESNDLEPDNSTSEDTGSSEGPSPGDALDRYCNHLGYEPESLGDNLYVCIPCGKGFPSSEQLNAHVEAHNEEELYHKAAAEQAVPFLDKGGPGLGDILHLGLKPFACDACGMRFTRQYRLTEHMRIHSGEKPYECQVCGGKFAQQRNLISHMKMHAAGPDGKAKLDFPDSVYAMARLTADQLGLKQEKAAELLSHTSHFLSDPKAMESLYPLAKFTAEHLGLSQDKAAEVLAQAPHLHAEAARTIERYSPP
uniref:HIC ZBTB transcriptional repressor 1 n=1 Tax=Apteryx owenii TaxID=8824 RepID=A0A8B9PJL7_APTOW